MESRDGRRRDASKTRPGWWGSAGEPVAASALWIAFTCILWLARGRKPRPEPVPEIPGDISPRKLTRPVILFAVIRALAVAIAVGIAFGLHLPNADWMPIATLVAMKPSLEQSALVAEQPVAGAILGALVAALFLLTIDNKHALEAIVVVFAFAAAALRTVNYAIYCAAIAALVLIADDIPHPANLTDEVRRVLFTLAGVGIAVLVMLLANQLQNAPARPRLQQQDPLRALPPTHDQRGSIPFAASQHRHRTPC